MMRGFGFNSDRRFNIVRAILFTLFLAQFQFMPAQAAAKYTGCANKKTGVIRLLTKGKCNSKTEKTITWNATGIPGVAGPAGAPGAQGPAGVNGKDGVDGKNGLDGKSGVDGKSGNTVLYGTTNPTSTTGVTGDFYINTATNMIFGPKTTVWPAGTSLVGPQGPGGVGPAGPQGPAGVTGASTQILWFTPHDLLPVQPTSYNDTSTVVAIDQGSNPPYSFEALDIKAGVRRIVYKPIPKGWSSAKSWTYRIYWMTTESSTANVKFGLYMNFVGTDTDFSTSQDRQLWAAPWGNDVFSKPTLGANKINVTTMNPLANILAGSGAIPSEGDLLIFEFTRDLYPSGLFSGKVYVLGISVQANFD